MNPLLLKETLNRDFTVLETENKREHRSNFIKRSQ
jgi:hypothetical protein